MREFQLFIGGQWKPSTSGESFVSLNPATGERVARCHLPAPGDIDEAVERAKEAFRENSSWRAMGPGERGEILFRIAEGIKKRAKELVDMEIRDSGSTLRKAKADIHNGAGFFKYMGKLAQSFPFEKPSVENSRSGFSKNTRLYEPIGVCAQIIPWNFPLVMASWKIAPVLASGCTTVLKSAGETPVTAYMLADILVEAGLPPGVVNIITGGPREGAHLVGREDIHKVAFTGSTAVGKEILGLSSKNVRSTTLELGGKSANVIFADADLSVAIDGALYGFLYHQGQACDSGTRILVEESIFEEFRDKMVARAREIKVGPPHLPETGLGPLINDVHFSRVMGHIRKAREEGANLLLGGEQIVEGECSKGCYLGPTLFQITPEHTLFHEEVFGPVAGLTPFVDEDEAMALANNSCYGLAGALWTRDGDRARRMASRMRCGTVWVNEYHLLNPGMPFGGFKQSGLGRELGEEGLLSYLEVKHLWESECPEREKKPWLDAIF